MAVQTVDFANINAVIKDGVILSEIELDGSLIWAAPPVAAGGVNRFFSPAFTSPLEYPEISAISGDGLVYAASHKNPNTIYIYSRPSVTSPNFTLLDTITYTNTMRYIQLSYDGSVLCFSFDGKAKIAVDDGAGSYTINQSFEDSLAPSASTSVSLGSDGTTLALLTRSLQLKVYINGGTKAAPNWITVYVRSLPPTTNAIAISSRNANGVTVATGYENQNPLSPVGKSAQSKGNRGQINRYVMDQNLQWSEAPVYIPASASRGVGKYLDISDDGRTIISSLPHNGPVSPDYSVTSSVSILAENLATNQLEPTYGEDSPYSAHSFVSMSGDGSVGAVFDSRSNPSIYATYDSGTPVNRFVYTKNTLNDSTDDFFAPERSSLSYDATIACMGDTVVEQSPQFAFSSTSTIPIINEGQSIGIRVDSFNVPSGTLLGYTITGIQAADLVEPLTGSFTISNSVANQVFNAVSDLTTEGNQTATITLDDYPSFSFDFTILDTSTTP